MTKFNVLYLPIGVPTFHIESINEQFNLSIELLKKTYSDTVCPEEPLLTISKLLEFIEGKDADLVIIQNNAFANSEYTTEILRNFNCDVLLWTLQEPVIDGGRLRLNSLTGAYSAGNVMHNLGKENFEYIWGSPKDDVVIKKVQSVIVAAKLKKELRSTTISSIGHTPEGFGFGRAIDAEFSKNFGIKHIAIEARELINKALKMTDEECDVYLNEVNKKMINLDKIPDNNVKAFVRLYKAYDDFIKQNNISAISSRCWPDYFVEYGTPVCAVLGMLNDKLIAASCEADSYGALSMLIGMKLTNEPVFFGDPVSLDEKENTITFWHCGTAACSLAHKDTGAETGVHPNRKIGPTMEFALKPSEQATIFRVGRKADGTVRFYISTGEILDKPKQFCGTSLVMKTKNNSLDIVKGSVLDGWEPHFIVAYKDISGELKTLGKFLNVEIYEY